MSASRCCSARRRPSSSTGWRARLYDRTTAIAAAALLAVSPLFWFYGSVGLTYAGEAFGASLVAWCAWGALEGRARVPLSGRAHPRPRGRHAPVRSRADLSALARLRGARRALVAARRRRRRGAHAAAVLAWLLPMIWLSGGLAAYVAASTQLYGSVVLPTSVLGGSLDVTLRPGALPRGVGHRGPRTAGARVRRAARVRAPRGLGPRRSGSSSPGSSRPPPSTRWCTSDRPATS